MALRVDTAGMMPAATALICLGDALRLHLRACARLAAELRDPPLRAGVRALVEVAGDVLELVAADLALLATKVRAGAVLYERVETSIALGAAGGRAAAGDSDAGDSDAGGPGVAR